jgi:hypothetical protein
MESTVLLDFPQKHHDSPEGIRIHELLHVLLVGIALVVKRGEIFFEFGAVRPLGKIIGPQQIRSLTAADAFQ